MKNAILFTVKLLLLIAIALWMHWVELNFEGVHWITYIIGATSFIYLAYSMFRHFRQASLFRKILLTGISAASGIYITYLLAIVLSYHLSGHRFSDHTQFVRDQYSYTFKKNGFYRYYEMELPPLLDYIEYGTYYHRDSAFYFKPLLSSSTNTLKGRLYLLDKKNITPPPPDSWKFKRVYDSKSNILTLTYTDYCGITRVFSDPADTLLFK